MPDYYQILQIARNAEPEVIAAAFKALAMKYHPDRNSSPDAHKKMQLLNEAYAVLGNRNRRSEFDKNYNTSSQTDDSETGNESCESPFSEFFRSHQFGKDEEFATEFDISGLFYEKKGEKYNLFRFYIDGLVLIRTVSAKADGSMPKIKIDRMLGDSFDYSGSYWLSRGMITFESYSENGLVSYTGRVCGREIMLTSFAHQTKETRTFNLQKR